MERVGKRSVVGFFSVVYIVSEDLGTVAFLTAVLALVSACQVVVLRLGLLSSATIKDELWYYCKYEHSYDNIQGERLADESKKIFDCCVENRDELGGSSSCLQWIDHRFGLLSELLIAVSIFEVIIALTTTIFMARLFNNFSENKIKVHTNYSSKCIDI